MVGNSGLRGFGKALLDVAFGVAVLVVGVLPLPRVRSAACRRRRSLTTGASHRNPQRTGYPKSPSLSVRFSLPRML
jgi:hypothetical protein